MPDDFDFNERAFLSALNNVECVCGCKSRVHELSGCGYCGCPRSSLEVLTLAIHRQPAADFSVNTQDVLDRLVQFAREVTDAA